MTVLTQGSSAVVTVTSSQTIGLNSANGAVAYIEATSGVPGAANKVRLANHSGGYAQYGPFGAGTVTVYAVSGSVDYDSTDPITSPDLQYPVMASATDSSTSLSLAQIAALKATTTPTPFTINAATQAARSLAASQIAYADTASTRLDEQWVNLANWTLFGTPGMQVSAGQLYSNGSGANAGANRGVGLAATENLRAVFTVNYLSGGASGGLIFGVSSDVSGAVPTSAATTAFGLQFRSSNTTPQSWSAGSGTDLSTQPVLVSGAYTVTITVDQTYISVVAVRVSNGEEIRARRLRAGFAVNNLYLFNGDNRQLTGISVARYGASKAIGSLGAVELTAERVQWSGDGTNQFKLHLPTSYDSRKPLTLIMGFHGAGADENHWTTNTNGKLVKDACIAAGYAFLGATGPNTSSWGAQSGLDGYLAAYNWFRGLYPLGAVHFYANSMGGIESLLSLAERRIPGVVSWVGTSPTANLLDNYTGGGGAFTGSINSAYSISSSNTYSVATAGHDPYLLDASSFRGVPMLFLAASDDVTVAKAANTDLFSAKVSGPNTVTVQAGITGGHSFSFAPYTTQIVSFFTASMLV